MSKCICIGEDGDVGNCPVHNLPQAEWKDESVRAAHAYGEAHCATCRCFESETNDARDAARYRAIRAARVGSHGCCEIWNVAYLGRQLDDAVDATIASSAVKTGAES